MFLMMEEKNESVVRGRERENRKWRRSAEGNRAGEGEDNGEQ